MLLRIPLQLSLLLAAQSQISIHSMQHNHQSHHHHSHQSHHHHCQHDHIQSRFHPTVRSSITEYENHPYDPSTSILRRLSGETSKSTSIRMVPYLAQMEVDLQGFNEQVIRLAKQLVTAAVTKLESMVDVLAPVQGNLRLHRECEYQILDEDDDSVLSCVTFQPDSICFLTEIPDEHLAKDDVFDLETAEWSHTLPGGTGIPDADLILYVTAQNDDEACVPGSAVVAWAGACIRDQYGRPVAGAINICPDNLRGLDESKWSMFQNVVLHELLHVLVFSQDNMAHFVDDEGQQIPLDHTIGQDTSGVEYVISPHVRAATREHFDCNTIHGAILEPRGGDGTSGNHWMINWHSELMGPVVFNNIGYVSKITCALFEDSGHYKVDYAQCAEPWRFGYHEGCAFFLEDCTDSTTQLPSQRQYFCNREYDSGCSWDGMSLASCRFIPETAIPLDDKYSQSVLNLEMCPFEEAQHRSSSDSNFQLCPHREALNRRCLRTETYGTTMSEDQVLFGKCYDVQCLDWNANNQKWDALRIAIDKEGGTFNSVESVICNRAEAFNSKVILLNGKSATITCPEIDAYCTTAVPFGCLHGHKDSEGEPCICRTGWKGNQCTERSTDILDLTPNHLVADNYPVPGLYANLIVTINGEDALSMTIQQSLLNGGYWYKTANDEFGEHQLLWYHILMRSWVISTTQSIEDGEEVRSLDAVCKAKEDIDNPDVVGHCNGKWMSLDEEPQRSLDITITECAECPVPHYFEAVRHEMIVKLGINLNKLVSKL